VNQERKEPLLSKIVGFVWGLVYRIHYHFRGKTKMVSVVEKKKDEDPFEGIPLPTRRWE
jgi:hypothetical protein